MPFQKKGTPTLRQKADKEARAAAFMLERVAGKTIKDIAKAYNCGTATVENYLAYGRKHGVVVNEAQKLVGTKLLPMALAVYEQQLEAGNLEAARDILFGVGVLSKTATVKHAAQDPQDTLDGFRDAYFHAIDVLTVPAGQSRPAPANSQPDPIHDEVKRLPERFADLPDQNAEDLDE